MNTRTVGLTCCSVPACATIITAVAVWAFLSSTASGARDPFQFASIMAANAKARVAESVGSQSSHPAEEVPVYTPPDLLAVPPPCLGSCA